MARQGRLLIILGLILALMTAGVVYILLQQAARPAPEAVKTTQVLVALQDIPERTDVPIEAVGTKAWPTDSVPDNALRNPAAVVGKTAIVPIVQGQIILSDMLIDKKAAIEKGSFAAFAIPPGKVAIAVPIDDESSVAGAIQSGDYVDLLVTITFTVQAPAGEGGEGTTALQQSLVTQLTLQNVEVLRVGPWNPPAPPAEGQPAPVVQNYLTLLLNQQDALALKYIRDDKNFSVDFVLRGVNDHYLVSTEAVSLEYILRRFTIPLPAAPPIITP